MPTKTKIKIMPAQAAIRAQELQDHRDELDKLLLPILAEQGLITIEDMQREFNSRQVTLTNIAALRNAAAPRCWPS